MRRSVIFSLFGLIVVGAIAGGFLLYQKSRISETNTNTPVPGQNANSTSVSTAPVIKGDITVNKSVTYRGVNFEVDTALKTQAYRRTKAEEGQTFLVLFLKPFPSVPSGEPLQWASQDVRLSTKAGRTIAPTELSLPRSADVSGGYFWFTYPTSETVSGLVFGSGASEQILPLDL